MRTPLHAIAYRLANFQDSRQCLEELHVYAGAASEAAAADATRAVRARGRHPDHRSYVVHAHDFRIADSWFNRTLLSRDAR